MRHYRPGSTTAHIGVLIALALAAAGCGGGGGGESIPSGGGGTSATSVSQCIVDAQNDVLIGAGAPDGCRGEVAMAPSDNPAALAQVTINSGGTLVVGPQSTQSSAAIGGLFGRLLTRAAAWVGVANAQTTSGSYPPVAEICVADGGTLTYGTAAKPITSATKIVQEFRGDRFFAPIGVKGKTPCAFDLGPQGIGFQKGIDVLAGGTLEMFGAKGVPSYKGISWTHLREPAGKPVDGAKVEPPPLRKMDAMDKGGDQVIELADDVTTVTAPGETWQPGDWIVIGTTSFNPFETEFVQIKTVEPNPKTGGSTITPAEPLKYYHFGSEAPSTGTSAACKDKEGNAVPASFCDKAAKNYGVDERAEVGLITRDIKLTSAVPASAESLHWGGEIKIHKGFKKVSIQGVEIEKFGKDQLGSYPIHFHMAGDVSSQAPLVDANSIHHSYNKCITIHATQNMTVQNNVCARIVGQIFYEETGAEQNITFMNNLGLGAMSNSFDIYDITTVPPNPTKVTRMELIDKYWWAGDYLTNNVPSSPTFNPAFPPPNGYDGFNIPNTDDQTNPVHGLCQKPNTNNQGGFGITRDPQAPISVGGKDQLFPCQSGGTCSFQPTDPNCALPEFYTIPANGFWISNPTTILIGNSIGGCQGVGRAYWWVPPNRPIMVNGNLVDVQYLKVGKFSNNRAHSCYAGFYGEGEFSVVGSGQFFPHADGTPNGAPVVAHFDGMTASRNRYRGMWLRPSFFEITNPRFATNRLSMSLVTSGGIDGNAPGAWDIVKDGVLVGLSRNNVDRFGPCPYPNALGQFTGGMAGCVDKTPYCDNCATLPKGVTAHSADEIGQGYADPSQNFFGYMLYDGPVRVFDDRFVNFKVDISKDLTTADQTYLDFYDKNSTTPTGQKPFVYEGDAVFGWFQSNQSDYPTGTVSKGLEFENTDLRHQIYTELVSLSNLFNDGDKNTAVIDEDGTLSGLAVVDSKGQPVPGLFPISLNNLPFNSASNSVDECLSGGGQNKQVEGRDSSLMSPGSLGTLEFSTLWPFGETGSTKTVGSDDKTLVFPGQTDSHTQLLTFSRDDLVPDGKGGTLRPTMTLHSRNGLGVWEPKVTSGFGYTVSAAVAEQKPPPLMPPYPQQPGYNKSTERVGFSSFIDVGLVDVVKPGISAAKPFYVRVGICYTRADGKHPTDATKFTIMRGYKSFTGAGVPTDAANNLYSTQLPCNNLDNAVPNNVLPNPTGVANCPSKSHAPLPLEGGGCPARSKLSDDGKSCLFDVESLTKADSIKATPDDKGLLNKDGTPNLGRYFYDDDPKSPGFGMLYFYAAQDQPNAIAPSPLGSCSNPPNPATDDPACPDYTMSKHKFRESYYACPAQGCTVYTAALNDPNFKYSVDLTDPDNNPGKSTCTPYGPDPETGEPIYGQSAPANLAQLVLAGTTEPPIDFQTKVDNQGVPFNTVKGTAPSCPVTTP
jgi:hypothetical protein